MIYAAFVGWVIAALAIGLWLGERGRRVFIQNLQTYGHGNSLQKAAAWDDETAEDRVEKTATTLANIMGVRVTRSGPEANGKIEHDPATIENGIEYLLSVAKAEGEQLSEEDARDEVERMLNAEGGDML